MYIRVSQPHVFLITTLFKFNVFVIETNKGIEQRKLINNCKYNYHENGWIYSSIFTYLGSLSQAKTVFRVAPERVRETLVQIYG